MKPFIDNYADILDFLDEKVDSINWDNFYKERKRPVPFITQNTMPDENLVAFLNNQTGIKSAIEFGCGEGRNAIYMAKQGIASFPRGSAPPCPPPAACTFIKINRAARQRPSAAERPERF